MKIELTKDELSTSTKDGGFVFIHSVDNRLCYEIYTPKGSIKVDGGYRIGIPLYKESEIEASPRVDYYWNVVFCPGIGRGFYRECPKEKPKDTAD